MSSIAGVGFQIQDHRILIVEPDGQVSFAVLDLISREVQPGLPLFVSVDHYDANNLQLDFRLRTLGVVKDARWTQVMPSFKKALRYPSLRAAYNHMVKYVRDVGFEVFQLTEERIYGNPPIPGH